MIRFAVSCGVAISACGCAQLAGLTGDYQVGSTGAGGEGASSGAGAVGASGGDASGGAPSTADAGASGEVNGGTSAGGSGNGGAHAGSGGAPATGAGPVNIGSSQFHDSASGDSHASSMLTDATFAKPPGTAQGDFMLVFFGADHHLTKVGSEDLAAEGWTLLDQHEEYGGDGQAAYLIYKFAGATEPEQIIFTGINPAVDGDGVQGLLSVYRGVNKTNPVNDYSVLVLPSGGDNVTNVDTPTPTVTTTVAHCLVIAGLSPDSSIDAPVITAWPKDFDEQQVSVSNPPHPYPYGWANIYAAERHVPSAGVVPQASFSWHPTSSDKKYFGSLAFTLALAP